MTGQKMYEIFAAAAAELPTAVTKGEALPAWPFLQEEVKQMWTLIGSHVNPKSTRA